MDTTKTIDISEARKQFSQLPEQLRENRVIWVTRHSKKAFAVVDMELMEAVLETLEILHDPDSLKMLHQSFEDIRAGRMIDHDDIEEAFKKGENRDNSRLDPMDGNSMGQSSKTAKKRK